MWPANLPDRAHWLPYSAEPVRHSPTLAPPPTPVSKPAPRVFVAPWRSWPPSYWRRLLVVSVGAGLVGVGGGMLVGVIAGVR